MNKKENKINLSLNCSETFAKAPMSYKHIHISDKKVN